MSEEFDVIVVGARCAGAPAAMLLARKGRRVLLVDKATFPSDTISTHVVHPRASAALARWGLLDRLLETKCPAIDTYAFDFGPFTIEGEPGTAALPAAYCPRRTVLDKLLIDAAVEAGVTVREGFTVDEVSIVGGRVVGIRGHESGRTPVTERARMVIGADGRQSLVAAAVRAERYHEKPPLLAGYYTYWSGLLMHGRFETYVRPSRGFAVAPTHDDLTMVVVGWPHAEFAANKRDVEQHYMRTLENVPSFAERLRKQAPKDTDLGEIPRIQRRAVAKPLSSFVKAAQGNRDAAIAAAFQSGDYTMKQIAEHFGVHYSTVSRVVKKAEEGIFG